LLSTLCLIFAIRLFFSSFKYCVWAKCLGRRWWDTSRDKREWKRKQKARLAELIGDTIILVIIRFLPCLFHRL
jgi:hypothetical protein